VCAPLAARRLDMLFDEPAQMLNVRAHAFRGNAVDVDEIVVVAVDEIPLHVQHITKTAGKSCAEVHTGRPKNAYHAAGHVFTTMVAGSFHNCECTGIADGESLAGAAGREQLSAGRAIQTGVAHDDGLARREIRSRRRPQDDTAAGHAFADVVIGFALEIEMQAACVPHPEALSGRTLQIDDQGRGAHARVAPAAGDLAGDPRADRAVEIIHGVYKTSAALAVDRRAHVL